MEQNVALFAATLLHSGTNAHFFHWSTDSYAKHVALGEYYEAIVDAVDEYVEAYMGRYAKINKFPSAYHQPSEPVRYLESMQSFIQEARKDLPQDSQLMNLVDAIADLVDTTVYKLKNLG